MKKKIKVHVEGIGEVLADEGYKLEKLSKKVFGKDYRKYIGARINNKIYNLQKYRRKYVY